ncbi:MAG: Clp protease ClpP [Bacteroidales bacterium]|nr:Clp protease ClpP [Bacteroidales bacterium]
MKYRGLQFHNNAEKTVEIDIEGYIGFSWWDDESEIIKTKEKMKAELKKLGNLDVDTIIVNINSYGGDVNHGISIHDLLAQNKAKIITRINGMTASAATIIAMAGEERLISDNALFLIHNSWTWSMGNKLEMESELINLKKVDNTIAELYAKATDQKVDDIQKIMDRSNGNGEWLTADEAKEFGFITEIFEPKKAAAAFSNDILQKHGLPPLPGTPAGEQNPDNNIDEERIADSVYAKVKNFFKDLTKQNSEKPQNYYDMSKFPKLSALIKAEKIEITDQGVILSEDNITQIENNISENETASTDLETFTASIDEIDPSVSEATTREDKIAAINAIIAAKPATAATSVEKDKDGNIIQDFSDVANDSINKEIDNYL